MGYGHLGYIGLAKESTFGTAVSPTDYLKGLSTSLTANIDRFDVENIFAAYTEPPDVAGLRRITGDIVIPGHPISIGHFLKALMNTVSGSVIGTSLWMTRFITPKSEFAVGLASRQPYTLEIFHDVGSAHQFTGCLMDRGVLSIAPNQELRFQSTWIGKSVGLVAKGSPTFPSTPAAPFTFDSLSLQIGGSANARLESFTVTVDNQLEGIPRLNGTNTVAAVLARGPQVVQLAGSIDFPDVTEYLDFLNQTERALKLSMFKAGSFQLVIDVPQFVYTSFPTGLAGRGRNVVQFAGKAFFNTNSQVAIDFQLTTTKSNY